MFKHKKEFFSTLCTALFATFFFAFGSRLVTPVFAEEEPIFVLGDFDEDAFGFLDATGSGPGLYKSIMISYQNDLNKREKVVLPTISGFERNSTASTNASVIINMPEGKTLNEIANYVKRIVFKNSPIGQSVKFSIIKEEIEHKTFFYGNNQHFYQYVKFDDGEDHHHWIDAYNAAKEKTFIGRKGYLATVTNFQEDLFIYNASSEVGFLGGTVLNHGDEIDDLYYEYNVDEHSTYDKTSMTSWYWACGPERGQVFFENSDTGSYNDDHAYAYNDETLGHYFNWYPGEPNGQDPGNSECCLTSLAVGTGYAAIKEGSDIPSSWNDMPEFADGVFPGAPRYAVKGYFVEYGDQTIGDSGDDIEGDDIVVNAPIGSDQTIGEEVDVFDNPTTSQYNTPIYTYYGDTVNSAAQYVIPASKLTDLIGKNIEGLIYYVNTASSSSLGQIGDPKYAGYLTEVESETLSDFIDVNESTKFFEGHVSLDDDELQIPFETPYVYNGGNLAICFVCVEPSSYCSAHFYSEELANGSIYRNSAGSSTSVQNRVPMTTILAGTISTDVAKNGEETYKLLKTAVKLANNGDTIELLDDIGEEEIEISKVITFSINSNGFDNSASIKPGKDYKLTTTVDGDVTTYCFKTLEYVAQIGSNKYASLEEAIEDVTEYGQIDLLANIDEEVEISEIKHFEINANSFINDASISGGTGFVASSIDGEDGHTIYSIRKIVAFDKNYKWNGGENITYGDDYDKTAPKIFDDDTELTNVVLDVTYYSTSDGVNWTKILGAPTNAGQYKVVFSVPDNNESYVGSKEFLFTIGKAMQVITFSDISKTYDNSPIVIAEYSQYYKTNYFTKLGDGAVSVEFKVTGEDDSTYTSTAPINAGNYTVRVSVAESSNYLAGSNTKEFTIESAKINKVGFGDVSQPIANEIAPTTVSDIAISARYTGSISWSPSLIDGKFDYNTTYTATVTLNIVPSSYDNYRFADNVSLVKPTEGWTKSPNSTGSQLIYTKTFDKTGKVPQIVAITSDISKIYDGTPVSTPTYTKLGDGIVTIEYKLSSQDDTAYTTTAPTNVGNYVVRVSVASSDTHLSGYDTATFTISKAKITIPSADPTEFTYNGNDQTYNIPDNDAYSVSGNTAKDAGTHTVTVTLNDPTNYEWADGTITDKTYTFVIGKAVPTYTAPTAKTITYNGEAQTLVNPGSTNDGTFVYSLTQEGEYTTTIPTGTNAGQYTIYWKLIGDNNHVDASGSVVVNIGKIKVTIPSADPTEFTYNGNDQTYNIPDNDAYSVSGNTAKDAGTHTVTVTLNDPTNYEWADGTITDKTYQFTILDAPIANNCIIHWFMLAILIIGLIVSVTFGFIFKKYLIGLVSSAICLIAGIVLLSIGKCSLCIGFGITNIVLFAVLTALMAFLYIKKHKNEDSSNEEDMNKTDSESDKTLDEDKEEE